jgi:hypothetical protein
MGEGPGPSNDSPPDCLEERRRPMKVFESETFESVARRDSHNGDSNLGLAIRSVTFVPTLLTGHMA